MTLATTPLSDVDIASPELYEHGIPHEAFARLRREDPVHWHPWDWTGGGFWAITTKADLTTVTRDWKSFTSEQHTNLWELTPEAQEVRRSIIETDGIAHTRLRRLVTQPFTLRRMVDYEDATRRIVTELLDETLSAGDVDVVASLSELLPIRVIVSILGVPAEDGDYMVELSNQLVEGTSKREIDPHAYGNTTALELLPFNSPAAYALFEYGRELGDERRANPHDDLVSKLVHAQIEGDSLTDAEFCNFFQLLVFAGNETTRTAISNGIAAFMDFGDQYERLLADPTLIPTAVEEIIRYAAPVLHMRRTAIAEAELNGKHIAVGDKLVLWYASANFDEAVYPDAMTFDVGRPTTPDHTSFGAFGPHHCLGAPLARLEIRILLEELVRRQVRFERNGEMKRARSNFVNGILTLPARVTAAR
jgi:cytochrome P450